MTICIIAFSGKQMFSHSDSLHDVKTSQKNNEKCTMKIKVSLIVKMSPS